MKLSTTTKFLRLWKDEHKTAGQLALLSYANDINREFTAKQASDETYTAHATTCAMIKGFVKPDRNGIAYLEKTREEQAHKRGGKMRYYKITKEGRVAIKALRSD